MSNQQSKVPFPQRDVVTYNQISNLIQVGSFAVSSMIAGNHAEPQKSIELDGGCKSSAETLFIKVCDKLDDILNDTDRWTFDSQHTLEGKLEKIYDQQSVFIEEQTKAAREVNTPHFSYRPILNRLPVTGEWLAYIGDLEDLDNAVVGIGKTPREALEAFDSLFTGDPMPDKLVEWLQERQMQLEQQIGKTNEQSVDDKRTGASRKTKRVGKKLPPNSGAAGSKPEIGGA